MGFLTTFFFCVVHAIFHILGIGLAVGFIAWMDESGGLTYSLEVNILAGVIESGEILGGDMNEEKRLLYTTLLQANGWVLPTIRWSGRILSVIAGYFYMGWLAGYYVQAPENFYTTGSTAKIIAVSAIKFIAIAGWIMWLWHSMNQAFTPDSVVEFLLLA